ncbi:MAG: FkbM family methyltransferase [Alphaproteobacteria bacterium]|nr:FkbM family methyltransferase [Alphaproteobacteria bacterium]
MLDRLAGLWRTTKRAIVAEGTDVDGFELGSFTLHGDTRTAAESPLRVAASTKAWSYLASWPNQWPVGRALGRGLKVELDVRLLAGRAEVGLVAGDLETFVHRTALVDGAQKVVLEAPDATAVAALVVRSIEEGSVAVEVVGLSSSMAETVKVRERGFLNKNATDDLVARLAVEKPIIVDVGANKGDTVARFLEAFPAAGVWALEPHPDTYAGMAPRFAGDTRVRPRRLALSSRAGTSIMHSYTNAAINSLSPVAQGAEGLVDGSVVASAAVEVELQSLRQFCTNEGLERVDILKLDTQGHELDILQGETEFLRSGKVRFVLVELLFSSVYATQGRAGEIIGLLEGCGFKLFDFYDFAYDETSGLKWGDALLEFAPAS